MMADHAYRNSYPRGGAVALLCEGDLIGYEAAMLGAWLDARLGTEPLVDVWPCGTASAIFGISDALGRSRPIIAIQDRDYRTLTEAAKDCARCKNDRVRREVRIAEWRCWRLNEIENYLLQPGVLEPVMASCFDCGVGDVTQVLSEVISVLPMYQAFQCALQQTRRFWEVSDPVHHLPSLQGGLTCKPRWNGTARCFECADFERIRAGLAETVEAWKRKFLAPGVSTSLADAESVRIFEECYSQWKSVNVTSSVWREEWAGKEVLRYLRMLLAARHGFWQPGTRQREPIDWGAMNDVERAEKDRGMERALQPDLVRAFMAYLRQANADPVTTEWSEIAELCRRAAAP